MYIDLKILLHINYAIASLCTILVAYQFLYIFVPFLKGGRKLKEKKQFKYAVLIPARNEENVIPHLIASIKGQTYPAELIDIFVIADNCTDNTGEAALNAGAYRIITRFNDKEVGKGFALDYALNVIREEYPNNEYEGYFVFDADNLLDENYIAEMNKMFSNGHKVITSYRNSKNYSSSWVSAGCSLWYLRESRFLNHARMLLGTSCSVSGTGFLVHKDVLEKTGGWKYFLLTEDIEFSIRNVLDGECIAYCDKAVLYDEQVVAFHQSWRQRTRWTKGTMQVTKRYFFKLLKGFFTGKGFACLDLTGAAMIPLIMTTIGFGIYVLCFVVAILSNSGYDAIIRSLLDAATNTYFILLGMGAITTISEWPKIYAPVWKKILYTFTFPIFMLSYVPITIAALFSRDWSWKPIYHTQAKSLDDIRK